ncbi:AsmA family protein [Luteimonas sp. 8-5]|uniref:AsmA family protein n=1 Tax=Luteimonas sp. 8-5 TaxID=3039387 RepID=UPI002436E68C|nr:AsmA family protein [Luteimonas sp. 8-5]MDG6347735.1 AsmA family protein [Luteimonas sp. 8-5]
MPAPQRTNIAGTVRRHPWLTALAVLLLALAVLVALWDWNWLKGPIERQVQARTGRSLDIGGNLDVDLGRVTRISAERVRFGNADWSDEKDMASTDRIEFGVRVWPLLQRKLIVPDIHLAKPELRLEKTAKQGNNWSFLSGDDEGDSGWKVQFRRLWVDDGRLVFLDPAAKTDIDVAVDSLAQAKDQTAPPIAVKGDGHWKGNPFTLRGTAESPLDLQDPQSPYRIDAHAQAGATRAHARGTLLDPLRLTDFDLKLALSGKDLDDLYPLLGVALPPSPPYELDGRLTRDIEGKQTTWHYDDFTGRVGDSDLGGDASVTTGGARPYLRANLVSRKLDFDDLAGFVGGAPDTGDGESTNPELAALAAQREASGKLLPDTPYNLEKLRAMDADVRWKAHRIEAPKLPLDDMDAHLLLEAGLLRLDPLNFGVAGGDIRSNIRMDARESPIRTRADIDARNLDIGPMLPDVELAQDAIGKLGGDIVLAGTGNSVAAMLGSSDGTAVVGMGRGQVSNLVMELAGLDIAEALKFLIQGDRKIPIRCAFGDFEVQDGLMTAKALAFDTTDTMIVGEGTISLKDETLDLRLRPRPKDRSLLVLRSPLIVEGTFKDPSFHPDMARVGLRSAIALVLGNIAPPAALLATLELGPGEDIECGGKYAK